MRKSDVEDIEFVRVRHTGNIFKIKSKDGLYRSGFIQLFGLRSGMPLYHDPYDLEPATEKEYLMQQLS